ncbi:MAG: HAMP domain-containing sensor histidine kinase [Bacillota bacterium]|nr:HAMP domain-containing sensor histidine kinase [Bacillota bacterium]
MLNTFQMLMVDLLFVLLIALFTEMLMDSKEYSKRRRTTAYSLSYTAALLFSLIFSVQINGKFMMDLRHTVFLIGGLYGGLYTLPVLSVIAITYVAIHSPHEAMANIVTILIETVVIFFLAKYYPKWRLRQKMTYIGFTVIIVGYAVMKIVQYFFHFTTGYDFFIISIYGGSVLILIFSMEWVRNSIEIKTRIQRTEKSEIVSHLAASIAHEIRNPLTVTKGFLQILENGDFPFEKKREYFSLAKSELDRAEEIISDYLTFAKPSSNKLQTLDVREEMMHLVEVIIPSANMNSVVIKTNLNPVMVMGEKPLFHQCILNILKNGIEAMEENGGSLIIMSRKKGNIVEIRISDTGIGMDKEQIQRLGEPYFSTKGKNGTGLGMMVVYSIIKSMNGKIKVESNLGQGTSFILQFPSVNELKETNSEI